MTVYEPIKTIERNFLQKKIVESMKNYVNNNLEKVLKTKKILHFSKFLKPLVMQKLWKLSLSLIPKYNPKNTENFFLNRGK